MSFEGKVVIVTGASSGIGAATAELFTKEGGLVVMVGRNELKLKKVTERCEKVGSKPLVIKADISIDAEAKKVIDETVNKFGKIDVLVNNAGFAKSGSVGNGKILEAYDETMKTNVRALINLTTIAAPHLTKTMGNVVNISSVAAKMTPRSSDFLAYHVSKAAVDHFSRCVALELAASGVRVNVVSPGPVITDILENSNIPGDLKDYANVLPLKRVSNPDEIADVIAFLASEKAKGITGSIFVSDNGLLVLR